LNDGYQASLLLLLPFIAKEFSISLTQIGGLGTLFFLFETLFALPAGYMGEKINGIKILLCAMVMYALSFFFMMFVPSYELLLVFYVLAGMGFAIFHPIAFVLIAKWSHKSSIGRSFGDFTAIGDIGRIGLSTVVTFLVVKIGWRLTSFIYSVTIFVFIFFFYLFFKRTKAQMQVKEELPTKVTLRDLLLNRRYMLACLVGLLDNAASTSLFIFLPFLLIHKGIDPAVLGSFAASYFIGNFLGKSVIGRITDRFGGVKTFILAEILMAGFILLLTVSSSLWVIILLSIVLGFLTKGTVPARATMAIESIADHGRYEKAVALLGFIASIGTVTAPLVYGRVADKYGITATFYVSAFFALCAVVPAILFGLTLKQGKQHI